MSVRTGQARLKEAARALGVAWDPVRRAWDDKVRRDFEREFLSRLPSIVDGASQAMDEMAELLQRARRDCE